MLYNSILCLQVVEVLCIEYNVVQEFLKFFNRLWGITRIMLCCLNLVSDMTLQLIYKYLNSL